MKVLKAFLVAPLAAPLVYWVTSLASAFADSARRNAAFHSLMSSFAVVMAFGSAVAYAVTLVFGGVVYWLLARDRPLPLAPTLIVGAVAGFVTAILLQPQLRGELFSIPLGPVRGAVMGLASALVFWWFLRKSD
jgi:hypothetical protein